jgi:hypothetical protein
MLKSTLMIVVMAVIASCNKDDAHKAKTLTINAKYSGPLNGGTIANGTYMGQLLADEKDNGFNTGPITRDVVIAFNSSNYTTITGPSGFAAESKGVFTLSGNKIALTDSLAHPADFDWGLILEGSYSYNVNADSLILTKMGGDNTYTYKLKKIVLQL